MNYVDVPEQRVLFVEPSRPSHRFDHFIGVQEAFFDYHFHGNVSTRYDFDLRVSEFSLSSLIFGASCSTTSSSEYGFLEPEIIIGFNTTWERSGGLEKDTNSGLNSVVQSPRDDFVFVANAYRQDFLIRLSPVR